MTEKNKKDFSELTNPKKKRTSKMIKKVDKNKKISIEKIIEHDYDEETRDKIRNTMNTGNFFLMFI